MSPTNHEMFKAISSIQIFVKKVYRKLDLERKKIFCQKILVLGDSHAGVFRQDLFRISFPKYFFNIVTVIGATVSGFKNPNSKTQALSTYQSRIKDSKAKTIIILLGEVDTGFVIWYRAEKYQTPVSEMLEEALTNYQKFLLTISKTFQTICISAPLPTIKDNQNYGAVANARSSIKATQKQRTQLTLQFNQKMQDFCQQNEILYLSLDQESLGSDGLVASRLINSDRSDHHYNRRTYAEIIVQHLKKIIP